MIYFNYQYRVGKRAAQYSNLGTFLSARWLVGERLVSLSNYVELCRTIAHFLSELVTSPRDEQ